MTTVKEVNTIMAKHPYMYDGDTYFKIIHSKFYKDVDVSYKEYLESLIKHNDEFVVDYSKLVEFQATDPNNEDKQYNLNKLELIKGKDYIKYKILEDSKYINVYKLTPHAFKFSLIRTENTMKYAEYYLTLESISLCHYMDYSNKYYANKLKK